MTSGNPEPQEPMLFSALLSPYRSLSPTGFLVMMALLVGVALAASLAFFLMGAWPIVGFLGLDVVLIYFAFKINYRAARACEWVTMTPSELRLRKVSARGDVAELTLNPVWVRLDREAHAEFGIERLFLVSHGRRFPIAGFLSPAEKAEFAAALSAALNEARRGLFGSPPPA
jgi:uncharacterized membrane protein